VSTLGPTAGLAQAPPVRRTLTGVLPFDPVLTVAVLALGAVSLLTLKGATDQDIPGDPNHYVERQGLFLLIGTVLAVLVSRFDYSRLRELRTGIYLFLIASILVVSVLGSDTRGSRRAISTPLFEIQASELGKVLLVLVLAGFLVDRSRNTRDRGTVLRAVALAVVPAAIVLSSDLGSGLVFCAEALVILFIAGIPGRQLAAILAVIVVGLTFVLAVLPAGGVNVLKPYQQDRLTSFLHPSDDPSDAGYQQNQSGIAIGAGQKTGRGDQATQTKYNFLPEHHTDFIFAVVGERWGFVGAGFVLSLYALLIWRGLRILTMAKNLFGALVAGGIVGMLLFQVFVNTGMNVGIMPITGIPLPLLSYGGSSVISTLLAIGLLQAIYFQAHGAAAQGGRTNRLLKGT
jgi:rod shape determining protein RodA